ESIVMTGFARYIALCEIRRPGPWSGGAATPERSSGRLWLPPRRGGAGLSRNPKPGGFYFDATPMIHFRDATLRSATGFLPYSTASPAAPRSYAWVAAVARLGVLPAWQSACSSTPPTPKKRGWW